MTRNFISDIIGRILFLPPKVPRTVQFEVTNECNLACKMCPREVLGVKFKHMPLKDFKLMVDKLKGVEEIILTGWGEPLYHPKLPDMVEYSKRKGFNTRFTTNGILLNEKLMDHFIKVGLDEISFSIESVTPNLKDEWGHMNKSSLNNILKLINKRPDKETPKITVQVMLQKNKLKEIINVVKWAGKNGVERVNFGRLDTRFDPNLKRPSEVEEKRIFSQAEKIGKRYDIEIDSIQYGLFTGFSRVAYKMGKSILHRGGKYCLKIYDYIYVNVDGKVTPCCLLPNDVQGDLKKQSLNSIWNSSRFKKRREIPHPSCNKCDVMKIRMVK